MTLTEGIYEIERGYRAVIVGKGTKIKIFKRKPQYEGYRCKDCAHCQTGKYAFSPNQFWESAFCTAKPNKRKRWNWQSAYKCMLFQPRKKDGIILFGTGPITNEQIEIIVNFLKEKLG